MLSGLLRISLKLSFYPSSDAEEILYGAHTDYTGFTVLLTDDVGGLEVFADDDWHPVIPEKHAFVINSADLIELWTNGLWKSNLHRVVNVHSKKDRLSIVAFTSPSYDSVIAPLEGINGEVKYEPISTAEYLERKLRITSSSKDQ